MPPPEKEAAAGHDSDRQQRCTGAILLHRSRFSKRQRVPAFSYSGFAELVAINLQGFPTDGTTAEARRDLPS